MQSSTSLIQHPLKGPCLQKACAPHAEEALGRWSFKEQIVRTSYYGLNTVLWHWWIALLSCRGGMLALKGGLCVHSSICTAFYMCLMGQQHAYLSRLLSKHIFSDSKGIISLCRNKSSKYHINDSKEFYFWCPFFWTDLCKTRHIVQNFTPVIPLTISGEKRKKNYVFLSHSLAVC